VPWGSTHALRPSAIGVCISRLHMGKCKFNSPWDPHLPRRCGPDCTYTVNTSSTHPVICPSVAHLYAGTSGLSTHWLSTAADLWLSVLWWIQPSTASKWSARGGLIPSLLAAEGSLNEM
jgi:hypothetical protein